MQQNRRNLANYFTNLHRNLFLLKRLKYQNSYPYQVVRDV